MTLKKKAQARRTVKRRLPAPRREPSDTQKAYAAGVKYAQDQLEGDYFMDWVLDQMIEASRMPSDRVLPLETQSDAMVIAKRMLQQLKWDTKRDLRAGDIEGLLDVKRTNPDGIQAFFDGFGETLVAAQEWLADELLEINQKMRGRSRSSLNERPRTSGHRRHRVSGSGFRAPSNPKNPGWYLRYSDGEVQGPHPGGEQAAKQAARSLSSSFPGMPVTAFQVEAKRAQAVSERHRAPIAERMYHVVAINERTGKKSYLTKTPVTHQEGITILRKQRPHRDVRKQLEPA